MKTENYYNLSNVMRKCKNCGKDHAVFYRLFRDGSLNLAMACPTSKPRTIFLPFEDNLSVPTLPLIKEKKQLTLL